MINIRCKANMVRIGVLFLFSLSSLFLSSCNTGNTNRLGVVDAKLSPCPASPNCVSSDAKDTAQLVKPFSFDGSPEQAWNLLIEQVALLPRVAIVKKDDHYLHAECRSRIFRFVDDLEFLLRSEAGLIEVRSASRTGYYDFGVNRARLDRLRQSLLERGVVR